MKIAHITDIHLDFLWTNVIRTQEEKINDFAYRCNDVAIEEDVDFFVLSGDISEGKTLLVDLEMFFKGLGFPCYFVLGNHDFWHTHTLTSTQRNVVASEYPIDHPHQKVYLSGLDGFVKHGEVALVGHDGWWDGGYGDLTKSVFMNDYYNVEDLKPYYGKDLDNKLVELAKYSASCLKSNILKAIEAGHQKIVIVTHVPPFPKNSVYKGRISDGIHLPCYASKATGDVVYDLAYEHDKVNFILFCGHSHGKANNLVLPNLRCITGEAEIGYPQVSGVWLF